MVLNPETGGATVVSCNGNKSACSVADTKNEKKWLFFNNFFPFYGTLY